MCNNIFSGMSLASPADIGVVMLQAVGSVSVFASPLAIRVGRILSLKNLREASWSSLICECLWLEPEVGLRRSLGTM